MKLGIVNSCEFCGDASIVGHSHPLILVKTTFFFCFFLKTKWMWESQTENYLTHVIIIITFAEI